MKYVERKTHRTSAGKSIKNIVVTVLSLLVFLLFVYPLIYTVINSLKTYEDFTGNPQWKFY